jgi:hypothetical protein
MSTNFSAEHLGVGQFYLMTFKDKDGNSFDGATTYPLNVPAPAPVTQYWSATIYDRASMALSGTCNGRAAPPRPRDFKRTRTTRLMFISVRKHQLAKSRTGFLPALMEGSRSSSASMGLKKPLFVKT